jgi:transcription elongation factor Elf1
LGITCPHCGKDFIVPHNYDNYAGTITCRACFFPFWVRIENGFIKETRKE